MVAKPPSLWFPDQGADALDALRRTEGQSLAVWFVRHASTVRAIEKTTAGKIDSGIVLGYPECCVAWHQAARRTELFRWRSANRKFVQGANETELDPGAFSPDFVSRNATLTLKNYPFVSHVACSRCLVNRRSPTSKLNSSLVELLGRSTQISFRHLPRWPWRR